MGIDARDIKDYACRILQISIKTSYRFVQKHPFVFGVFLFFFLIYIFLPFIFNFLFYSSPFLVCIAILLRIFWSSEQSHIQSVEGDEKRNNVILQEKSKSVEYDVVVDRNDFFSLQCQTSRRRNVIEKKKELDVQSGNKEEDIVLQTTPNENSISKTATEEKECYSSEHGESSTANVSAAKDIQNLDEHHALLDSESQSELESSDGAEQTHKFDTGGIELEGDNMEEADDDEEEEAQEDGNNALEWTEDDQKNLTDLGLSELERNKRLESLIAKRRARKLFRMQVEKGLIHLDSNPPGQIAPIFVAKNNPFDVPNLLDDIEGLKMPGSAPSILLPTGNPFDLPYDPLEEKPNLMGDSFHQEFMAAHQKDMLFCRHESFCLGPSFPLESKQDRHDAGFSPFFVTEKGALEGPVYSRFKRQSNIGEFDQKIEQLYSKDGDCISHIDCTPDLVKTGAQAPNKVIKSVDNNHEEDKITNNNMTDIKGEEEMERSHGMESMYTSEVHIEPNLIESSDESDSSSSSEENERILNAYRSEVSENLESSPALKSIMCLPPKPESDPSFDSSPPANDKNRRDGSIFFAYKGSCHTPTYSIASDLQVEYSDDSPPLTVDGTNSATDAESMTYDEEMEKEATYGSEGTWGASSHLSGLQEYEPKSRGIHEISQRDTVEGGFLGVNKNSKDEIVTSIRPQQVDDQESTDMSTLSSSTIDISGETQAQSININHKIHDDIKQVVEEVREPKPKSSNSSDLSAPENLERAMDLVEKSMAHSPHEAYSGKPEDISYPHEMSTREVNAINDVNHTVAQATADMEELKMIEEILDSMKAIEGNKDSKPTEEVDGNQVKLTEDEGIMDISKPIEANDNWKSIQENKDEQSIIESGASELNQNSDYPIASAAQQELVVEEVPISSSSSSSPTSVLTEKIPTDQASSSTSNQTIHIVILKSHLEDTAQTSSGDEQPPLNLTPTAQPMVKDSTAPPSNNSGFENLLESSNPPEKSTEETNIFDNLNAPMVNEREGKENTKSYQAIKGESETLISHEGRLVGSACLSKPAEDNNHILRTMEPEKFTAEDNTIYNVNDPEVIEKEDKEKFKSVGKSEGESQSSIKQEGSMDSPKPDEPTSSKFVDVDVKFGKLIEGEALLGPSKSFEDMENSRTKEETEDSHEPIFHPPNSDDNTCNQENIKHVGDESESEKEPSNPLPLKSTPES